jgi:peptidoglycan/xylan/chitin deacetylase (PgdA/CDA1 family)
LFQPVNKVGYVQIDDADLHTYTPTGFAQAMISMTFDDGWLDQFTNGRTVLNQYNIPSTYYLLTGTVNDPAYMTVANMQTLGTDPVGNELASHTIHHCSLSSTANHTDDAANCPVPLTVPQMDGELGGAQTQLRSWFPSLGGVASNFATPYGEYDTTTLNEIQKYYRSHRSTETGYNTKDNFNRYNIKVQNILDTTTPAQVQQWVDQAILDKSWLVLVYHRVLAIDPSTAEDYNVTPANLATEAQYIQSKVTTGNITVKTVDQALTALEPQIGAMPLPGGGTTTPPTSKVGDVTGDGVVDSRDATVMFANWNKTGTGLIGDVTGDGVVDSRDATVMFANWSK